jgi:glutaredoxin
MVWRNRWFRKEVPNRARVTLYTRQNCHLCEDAHRVLTEEQWRYGFAMEVRDIDLDAELKREFGECVPVVAVNGRVHLRGGINRVLLRRILAHYPSLPDSCETGRDGGSAGPS